MLKNCWVKDGINWFILNNDGSMKADELLVIDGDLYYFRSLLPCSSLPLILTFFRVFH